MQNHKRCNDDQDALKNSREIFGLGMSECDISIRRVVTPICDAHGRGSAVAHQTTGLTSAVFATQLIDSLGMSARTSRQLTSHFRVVCSGRPGTDLMQVNAQIRLAT